MSDASVLDSIIVICAEQGNKPATADSNIVDDLGLDSLDLSSVAMSIEIQYPAVGDIDYDPATMQTCRDLANVVEARLKAKSVNA